MIWFGRFFNILPYPFFGSCHNSLTPDSYTSPCSRYRTVRNEADSNRRLGPYGWVSNWGGRVQFNSYSENLSLGMIQDFQSMENGTAPFLQNRDYVQEGAYLANNIINSTKLKIGFEYFVKGINTNLKNINAELEQTDLTADKKTKLEAIKKQLVELKKQAETFKETSSDKSITEALEELESMKGNLAEINSGELKDLITIQDVDDANVVDNTEELEEVEEEEQNVPPKQITNMDELKTDYDSKAEFIDNVLTKYVNITTEDKKKLTEDKKALDDAIAANKSFEEVKPLYDKLLGTLKNTTVNIEVYKKYRIEFNNIVKNVNKTLKNKNNNLTQKDKETLVKKLNELKAAISEKKSITKIKFLYNELQKYLSSISGKMKDNSASAALDICTEIYKNSTEITLDPSKKDAREAAIRKAVLKINKDNVVQVLDHWSQQKYNDATKNTCLLETIYNSAQRFPYYGEYAHKLQKELLSHITKAIKEYAKEKGVLNKVSRDIAIIEGEYDCFSWNLEEMYDAFKRVHKAIGTTLEESEGSITPV